MEYNENLIESIVKQVILEYGGVSNEIIDLSYYIFNEILRQHREYGRGVVPHLEYNGGWVYYKQFNLNFSQNKELCNIVNEINVTLFFYDSTKISYEEFDSFLKENHLIKLSFNPELKRIRLSFAWSNNDSIEGDARYDIQSSINHEVKHAYQSFKKGNVSNGISPQYLKATKEMENGFGVDESAIKRYVTYVIPYVYYKLDKEEIDAWVQEMYIQATTDIKKTKIYKSLISTLESYNVLKKLYLSNDDDFEKNIHDYIDKSIRRIDNPRSYFKVCDANVSYLKRKMRRVIGRWYEDTMQTNGSFKQYTSNEIPMGTPFIQTNSKNTKYSRLANLFNKYFSRKKR